MTGAASQIDDVSAAVCGALFGELPEAGNGQLAAIEATVWRGIDALHKRHDDSRQIALLESISLELYKLRRGFSESQQASKSLLARLSREWLYNAPLTRQFIASVN